MVIYTPESNMFEAPQYSYTIKYMINEDGYEVRISGVSLRSKQSYRLILVKTKESARFHGESHLNDLHKTAMKRAYKLLFAVMQVDLDA